MDFPHVFKDVPIRPFDESSMKVEAAAKGIEMMHLTKYTNLLSAHIESIEKKYPVIAFVVAAAITNEVADHKNKTDADALSFVMEVATLIETLQLAYDSISETSKK